MYLFDTISDSLIYRYSPPSSKCCVPEISKTATIKMQILIMIFFFIYIFIKSPPLFCGFVPRFFCYTDPHDSTCEDHHFKSKEKGCADDNGSCLIHFVKPSIWIRWLSSLTSLEKGLVFCRFPPFPGYPIAGCCHLPPSKTTQIPCFPQRIRAAFLIHFVVVLTACASDDFFLSLYIWSSTCSVVCI